MNYQEKVVTDWFFNYKEGNAALSALEQVCGQKGYSVSYGFRFENKIFKPDTVKLGVEISKIDEFGEEEILQCRRITSEGVELLPCSAELHLGYYDRWRKKFEINQSFDDQLLSVVEQFKLLLDLKF